MKKVPNKIFIFFPANGLLLRIFAVPISTFVEWAETKSSFFVVYTNLFTPFLFYLHGILIYSTEIMSDSACH